MPTAELIAIGTELLLGEIIDTNSQYLARQLRDCGIDLFRVTTVGDNLQRITSSIQDSLSRADIVITTGGLGPTVDDPTREAAASAFGDRQIEFHPELWSKIQERFTRRGMKVSENNKKQAYIPQGATVIENPVGTAPAFFLSENHKTLICLPGVPREMETLMQIAVIPWLKENYQLHAVIVAKVLHVAGVAESAVDEKIANFEKLTNPTVGLLAHPGIVDIRITAKAESVSIANEQIAELETKIRQLFVNDIFGMDKESLPDSIQKLSKQVPFPIEIVTSGFPVTAFAGLASPEIILEFLEETAFHKYMSQITEKARKNRCIFTCKYSSLQGVARLELGYTLNQDQQLSTREYPGAPALHQEWAENICLSYIWHELNSLIK